MARIKTHLYDAAAYLASKEDCALYFQAVINESEGDPTMIVTALGEIARHHATRQRGGDSQRRAL